MYPIYASRPRAEKHWLPKLRQRRADQAASASPEPDYGSNPAGMITTAKETADGWELNGAKMWITNGRPPTSHRLGQDGRADD